MQQSSSTNQIQSDNEESFVASSTPPSLPTHQKFKKPSSIEKINSNVSSPCLSVKFEQADPKYASKLQNESAIMKKDNDQYSLTSQTSSTCNRGLDRMLLERNIEKLLEQTETSGFQSSVSQSNSMTENSNRSPQINRLLHQDRSREPLDLTDLGVSLDNLSPKCNTSTNETSDQQTKEEANLTSSMPELHVIQSPNKTEELRSSREVIVEAKQSLKTSLNFVAEPSKPIGKENLINLMFFNN